MRIVLTTRVRADYREVFKGFTREFFLKLTPPLTKIELSRFDGCHANDEIKLDIIALGIRKHWEGKIVYQAETEGEVFFVDEGRQLPSPLTFWRHWHRIIDKGDHSEIVDDIQFRSSNRLLDLVIWPLLRLQFQTRKAIYRKEFGAV